MNINSFKRFFFSFIFFFILAVAVFIALMITVKIPEQNLYGKESTVIFDKNGNMLRVFPKDGQFYLPYSETDIVPEKLKKAVLFFEDKRFEDHFGVDFLAVGRAAFQNIKKQKIHSGASTITMQLSRLMGERDRTFFNKAVESVIAMKIERKWSKDEILRKYLTYCPYGQNIHGYKTAAKKYFKKDPSELDWSEAALLAILPNAPGLMHPEKNRARLTRKRDTLLENMMNAGIISKTEYEEAVSKEPPKISIPFQTNAWHLTRNIESRTHPKNVYTTIDISLQTFTEAAIKDFSSQTDSGLTNFAVIVADNRKSEVITYVGSHNFFDEYNNGQVDALISRRPVDGFLQPFLFALSVDNFGLEMDDMLNDVKKNYGTYTPTNRDDIYLKKVKAGVALRELRNVPAVNLLDQLGIENFYTFLKEAGAKSIPQPPEFYGYSFVSGGFDLQPVELATLYAGLASGGKFSKLETILNKEKAKPQQLFSKKAAREVVEALRFKKSSKGKISYVAACTRNKRECFAILFNADDTLLIWGGSATGYSDKIKYDPSENLSDIALSLFERIKDQPAQ
ncbi:MAG TPA: transglycosylase domain-containing protein [bacterium]|nr:transglycosylase domain-containing protein [bacterium]HPS30716.1 transglycosylase domain-containing protein [bacterium]